MTAAESAYRARLRRRNARPSPPAFGSCAAPPGDRAEIETADAAEAADAAGQATMKLLEIEGAPKLAVVEIPDGHHRSGLPLAAGFYVCDPTAGGIDGVIQGPYPTPAHAKTGATGRDSSACFAGTPTVEERIGEAAASAAVAIAMGMADFAEAGAMSLDTKLKGGRALGAVTELAPPCVQGVDAVSAGTEQATWLALVQETVR